MTAPLVSILVPAYNAERWLGETLASATGQTYANTEVVVVDDGSTDGTLEVARAFEGPRVKVVSQDNAGLSGAQNRAFAESQGDYIQYLDADDLLVPDKVERQVRHLHGEPPTTIASGPWVRFEGQPPGPEDRPAPLPDWRDHDRPERWLVESWAHGGMFPSFSWLTPRPLIEAAGPWNEAIVREQDGEFFTRVLLGAERIAFCPGAWGFYRGGIPGSVSRRGGREVLGSVFEVVDLYDGHLQSVGDGPDVRRARAALWERFMYEAYAHDRSLARRAEDRASALGGAGTRPSGGRAFDVIQAVAGWKPAVRLQAAWYRVRYQR